MDVKGCIWTWESVYDDWMQWVLGVCKFMYGDGVWRMLGECKCVSIQKKMFVTLYLNHIMSYYYINCQNVLQKEQLSTRALLFLIKTKCYIIAMLCVCLIVTS